MFAKLLVPLDGSPLAEGALGQAAAIARAAGASIEVVLVHQLVPFDGVTDAPWSAAALAHEHRYMESIASELAAGAGDVATHAILEGSPVEMICCHAVDLNADLIVMTSHGRTGISRAWLGSVADGVLRHSPTPVLMLRPVEGPRATSAARHLFTHILVPLDESVSSEAILPAATALARCGGARITLLQAVDAVPLMLFEAGMPFVYSQTVRDDDATARVVDDARIRLGRIARHVYDDSGVEIDAEVVVDGSPAQAILGFARTHEIDLIAMTTHGRGASRVLMGSVADKMLRASTLPVLMTRPLAAESQPTFRAPAVDRQRSALADV